MKCKSESRDRTGKKGQMFLIAAVVIIASMVIIKFNMAGPAAKKQQETLEVRFEHDIFENIKTEFDNTLRFSYYTPQAMTENVFDFANFTESKMAGHSMGFTFLYVGVISNSTTNTLNVSLINMLDNSIDANFTLNDSSTQSNATVGIVNYEQWDTDYAITVGDTYQLDLTYNSTSGDASTSKTESVTVKTKKNKDVYVGFFYIVLESEDATHAGNYQKTVNIH